ncbi:MAG: hypothetical protein C0451_05380 [Comamonadaceae bacterium]|nr:hypothetical protein [Comamonadaceae bacterium]
MNIRSLLLLALLLPAALTATAQSRRPQVDLKCEAHGMGPLLDCTVRLRGADGQPLPGAGVTLGATMPSMPMAHTVKPVKALPTAVPGEYRGQLTLEMSGAWAIEIDLTGPVRERVVRVLMAEECDGDGRCPAPPARR